MKLTTNLAAVRDDILSLARNLTDDKIARTVALSSRALILNRVQQRGQNSKNVSFKPYSTRPFSVPYAAFLRDNKYALNKQAITQVRRLLARPRLLPHSLSDDEIELFKGKDGVLYIVFGGGYKQFRKLAGRQTARVDMTLTGQMLNDFNVIPLGRKWGLGFSNILNAKKYAQNINRRGQFLILSDNELLQIRDVFIDELNRIIKQSR